MLQRDALKKAKFAYLYPLPMRKRGESQSFPFTIYLDNGKDALVMLHPYTDAKTGKNGQYYFEFHPGEKLLPYQVQRNKRQNSNIFPPYFFEVQFMQDCQEIRLSLQKVNPTLQVYRMSGFSVSSC